MFNFKSKITEKLLGYFLLNTKAEHYVNELSKMLSLDPGNLNRKLKELEKEGIFISKKIGNQKHYSLNKSYPLLSELRKIFNLKYGMEGKLAESLKKLKGIKNAYIFGSYARGTFDSESDIDLLLIGEHSSIEAKRILARMEKLYKREFSVVDMTEKEFKAGERKKDEFISNIFSHKIIKLI